MLYNMTPDFVDTPQKYIDQCGEDYVKNDWDEWDDEQVELLEKCVNDKYMDVYEVVTKTIFGADIAVELHAIVNNGVLNIFNFSEGTDIHVMYGAAYGYQVYGEYACADIEAVTIAATGNVDEDADKIVAAIKGEN